MTHKKTEKMYHPETDFVITTRELAMLIRETNIDFNSLKDEEYDSLMGASSTSGLIFGASGGVTEAILRTAYYMINGKVAPNSRIIDQAQPREDILRLVVSSEALYRRS